jgi:hypothetical protein
VRTDRRGNKQKPTIKYRTSEITEELLEEIGLLRGNLVPSVTLATLLNIVGSKTHAELSVEPIRRNRYTILTRLERGLRLPKLPPFRTLDGYILLSL